MYDDALTAIFADAAGKYKKGATVQVCRDIPSDIDSIPNDNNHWLKLEDVLCVYLDMKDSTRLSAAQQDKATANAYQYFTDTAVRVLNHFEAVYIDVRGDGAFGLFNKNRFYHGMAAAITFLTFANNDLKRNAVINGKPLACHIGADVKTVLVKRLGLRNVEGKTDKQNEVWAGKPVNMAAKLASHGGSNEFHISERVFNRIKAEKCEDLLLNCGCHNGEATGIKSEAWTGIDVPENEQHIFDFSKYYRLKTHGWCLSTHGENALGAVCAHDK